jgi:hypothetical protein
LRNGQTSFLPDKANPTRSPTSSGTTSAPLPSANGRPGPSGGPGHVTKGL